MHTIRQAKQEDLPLLLKVERDNMKESVDALNPKPWSDDDCLDHLRGCLHESSLWVCEDESGIIGHYCYSLIQRSGTISLDSMQVRSIRQNQGIGALLMADFLARIHTVSASKVALNIHLGSAAIRLYERFGICEVRRTSSHIRMEKDLA